MLKPKRLNGTFRGELVSYDFHCGARLEVVFESKKERSILVHGGPNTI